MMIRIKFYAVIGRNPKLEESGDMFIDPNDISSLSTPTVSPEMPTEDRDKILKILKNLYYVEIKYCSTKFLVQKDVILKFMKKIKYDDLTK